ncbi:MAG: nucleoside triphosphate pyrophosphatase [Candidimonas sp.]
MTSASRATARLYLASASPRRREILDRIGIDHDVLLVPAPPGEDEPRLPGEDPDVYVRRTARDKAVRARTWLRSRAAASHDGGGQEDRIPPDDGRSERQNTLDARRPVLAADTTVILDGAILGKPRDAADAKRMLGLLSGGVHAVHTAVVLSWQDRLWEDVSISEVRFARLSATEIDAYCDSGEPHGKAGAYGIQGKASVFVEHISGSYTGIMGLPTHETYRLLKAAGLAAAG